MNNFQQKPLLVIVGPTASGKSSLALQLAQDLGGEIISADSRSIYKGLDIGTAKPSILEQRKVPHFGLDLAMPDERFTVADFQKYAKKKIAEIRARGKMPILVGGSGLYVDSVIFDYEMQDDFSSEERNRLNSLSIEELTSYCHENNIKLPENNKNKRYLVRAIEKSGKTSQNRDKIIDNCLVIGLELPKDVLMKRIEQRIDKMFEDGISEETKTLVKKYGLENEAMKSNIYPIVWRMIEGGITQEEAKKLAITADWRLAKKQRTWFKRNPFIYWFTPEGAVSEVKNLLKL